MGFLCSVFLCVWPSVVPNQRQLSIIVSDWESYLGRLFPTYVVGSCFCTALVAYGTVRSFCFHFVILVLVLIEINMMTTNYAEPWSPSSKAQSV